MWKTLEELEKYLYMSQDETLRRVGQSLITLVEQEIEVKNVDVVGLSVPFSVGGIEDGVRFDRPLQAASTTPREVFLLRPR